MINEREIGQHIQDGGLKQQTIWRKLKESQDIKGTIKELTNVMARYKGLIEEYLLQGKREFAEIMRQRLVEVGNLRKELHDKS